MSKLIILAESYEAFKELMRNTLAELQPPTSPAPAAGPPTELLTIEQVCRMLNVSKTTLAEWRAAGIIPYKRYGKRIFFELEAVLKAGSEHEKYSRRAA
jgi:excisionase family DNA binding protein